MKHFKILFLSVLFCISAFKCGYAQEKAVCLECHSDNDLVTEDENGKEISLFVNDTLYSESAHSGMDCIECHTALEGIDDGGHDVPVPKVNCALCHDDVAEIYKTSIHGQLKEMGDKLVPGCSSCHGKHDIFPTSDSRSSVNKFNLMYTCAKCHQSEELTKNGVFSQPNAVPQFYESVHAKGLLKDGLIVSPSCNDCHGTHNIQVAANPSSPIYKRNVYKTCGKCHTKVEDDYKKSIHGQLVENGDKRGPVCTDCHQSHKIIPPDMIGFKQHSDQICGRCHTDKLERYHETFHGKAMALGSTRVAACYDCHGHHDIQPTEVATSHTNPANVVETCRKCHKHANKGFASYITHADHFDKKNYPQLYYAFIFMTVLLIGVFAFFGLHTLLWIARSLALYIRDSKTFRELKVRAKEDDTFYIRFTPVERFIHILIIISFTTLVITGMPLKFFYTNWGHRLISLFGGVENAGYLHRFAAIIMVLIFGLHVLGMVRKFFHDFSKLKDPETKKFSLKAINRYFFGPDSIIPHPRDIKDFWNHQKWFFGKGEKPKFDRWTYWEKFDYFAVFWGIFIIGASGLIMWFPNFFTAFLPGWIINIAQIIHSDEALLAAGFIFTFHFFNVHFRIEKYPMDTVIFSGRISKTEMEEERAGWLERLKKDKKLDSFKPKDEWEGWKPIVQTFGFIAFGTGVILALVIFTAMITRLFH